MKVAFIGLGYAARRLHLPAARSVGETSVVGGADPDGDARRAWEREARAPAFDDAAEMLRSCRPDMVVVATPPHAHAEACLQALQSGAHVLCEKPFVETLEQADRVIAAAASSGRVVAVNHEFRYMPIFSAVARVAGSAESGRPVFLQAVQLMDLAPWEEQVAWRAAMPERALFEGGVHIVDLVLMVLGRTPQSVSATTSSGLDTSRRSDAIHLVTMDFGDGLLAQIIIDRLCRSGTRYLDLRLDCEQASVRASMGGRAFVQIGVKRAERPGVRVDFGLGGLAWIERGLGRKVIARSPRDPAARATAALWRDSVAAMRQGAEARTSAVAAREGLRVIEAAYDSARSGARVRL